MITQTVGRIMWFYPAANTAANNFAPPDAGEPLAAIVAQYDVIDNTVNLAVIDACGVSHPRCGVAVVQEGGEAPADGYYASWMPYQLAAAKSSA